jgi:hypothetical protein
VANASVFLSFWDSESFAWAFQLSLSFCSRGPRARATGGRMNGFGKRARSKAMLSVRRSGIDQRTSCLMALVGYRCHWVGQAVQWTDYSTAHWSLHSLTTVVTEFCRYTQHFFWGIWESGTYLGWCGEHSFEVTELRLTTAAVKTHSSSTSTVLPSSNTMLYFDTPQAPNSEWERRKKKIKFWAFGHIRSCACIVTAVLE